MNNKFRYRSDHLENGEHQMDCGWGEKLKKREDGAAEKDAIERARKWHIGCSCYDTGQTLMKVGVMEGEQWHADSIGCGDVHSRHSMQPQVTGPVAQPKVGHALGSEEHHGIGYGVP